MAGVGREGGVCAGGHSVHPKASADGRGDTARAGGGSLENSTYQCNYDCWDGSNLIFLSYFRWNSGISDLVTSFGAMRYFFKKQALPDTLTFDPHTTKERMLSGIGFQGEYRIEVGFHGNAPFFTHLVRTVHTHVRPPQ